MNLFSHGLSVILHPHLTSCWLFAEKAKTGFQKLDPPTQIKALAALAGLVILGFAMILLARLGAHWARRYMDYTPGASFHAKGSTWSDDDWAKKPVVPKPDDDDE